MRCWFLLAVMLLAGCVQPGGDSTTSSRLSVGESMPPPPILFGESTQGHALVVLGVECCNFTWDLVTIQAGGDDGCDYHAPTSGTILAGESMQALLPMQDSQCSYSVAYGGISLGDFLFAPNTPSVEVVTATQTVTQEPPQNDTQPQGGNGTVPPQ